MKISLGLAATFSVLFIFQNCSAGGGSPVGTGGGGGGGSTTTSHAVTVTNQVVYAGSAFDSPNMLAVDGSGVVWVTDSNASGKGVIRIAVGAATNCSSGCTSVTAQGLGSSNLAGLAIDGAGSVWLKSGLIYKISNAGSIVSAGPNGWGASNNFYGDYNGTIDSSGNFWFGNTNLSVGNIGKMSTGGTVLSAGYGAAGLSNPLSVAVDGSDNIWVANITSSNTGNIIKFPGSTPTSPVIYTGGGILSPVAVAVDPSGNIWVANNNTGFGTGSDGSVVKIAVGAAANCSTGCTKYTHSYLHTVVAVAADGDGNIWVANGVDGSVTEIISGAPSDCLTGCVKFSSAGLGSAKHLAIDRSGNVWIASSVGVVKFPGIAAATQTPISRQSRGAAVGTFWNNQDSGIFGNINSVANSGSLFAAVTNAGEIATSPNGYTWTTRTSPVSGIALNSIVWSNSQFVAVGNNGSIVTSSNGITWTLRSSGTVASLTGVAWSGSNYLAVGAAILTSSDGVSWTLRGAAPHVSYSGLAWSGTRFVAINSAFAIDSTADGISWSTASSLPAYCGTCSISLNAIASSGSRLIVVGGNTTGTAVVWTSTDVGSDGWTNVTPPAFVSPIGLVAVTWSGAEFVTAGYNGNIATAVNGTTWMVRNSGTSNAFTSATATTSKYILGSGSTIYTSP